MFLGDIEKEKKKLQAEIEEIRRLTHVRETVDKKYYE